MGTDIDASCEKWVTNRRSKTGIIAYIGIHALYLSSNNPTLVAHRATEEEYIVADSAAGMVVWLRRLLHCIGMGLREPTIMHEEKGACEITRGEEKLLQSKKNPHPISLPEGVG